MLAGGKGSGSLKVLYIEDGESYYPMILTELNPLLFRSDRNEVPMWPMSSTDIVHVGYLVLIAPVSPMSFQSAVYARAVAVL
jgi:hypothetical protein